MDDRFILTESFSEYFNREKSIRNLEKMYAYDLLCLEQIIEEGMFSNLAKYAQKAKTNIQSTATNLKSKVTDTVKNVSQQAKDTVQNVKQFAGDKLQQMFSSLIVKAIKSNKTEANKVAKELEKISKNPDELRKNAVEGEKLLSGNTIKQESYYSNTNFLIESLYSSLYRTVNLNEAVKKTAKATKNSKSVKTSGTARRSLKSIEDQLIQILSTYKSDQARQNALSKFNQNISKKIGVAQSANQSTQAQQPTQASAQQQKPQVKSQAQPQSQEQQAEQPQDNKSEGKGGLFKKAIEFVKNNPNLTSGAVIALVSAIALATGGTATLIPLIYSGLTGATLAGGVDAAKQKLAGVGGAFASGGIEAAKQKIKDNKVDLKSVGSSALKGAATGMAIGGVKKAASAVADVFSGDDNTENNNQKPNNSNSSNKNAWARYAHEKANQIRYQQDIARATGVKDFVLKGGIPYDSQGHKLDISDETLDKLVKKHNMGDAVMTKSNIQAGIERGKMPVKKGGINDF
jgi:hypothetical protein